VSRGCSENINYKLKTTNYKLLLSLRAKLNHLSKIKVGAVSYLNTKPLLYGIKNHPVINEIELTEEYPSLLAQKLIEGSIDVGLVPVAIIPDLKEWHIVGDYCIGCDGAVASVCLFSEVPMEEIKKVYLDYQSRTSVMLLKILLKEYWQKNVEFIEAASEDYRNEIKDTTAGLVIGDRALEQKQHSKYCYDLGEAWKDHTGLPFVFAAWISNKQLPESFIVQFNAANKDGLERLDAVIAEADYSFFDLREYYMKRISYKLDGEKKRGLSTFLEKIRAI
jgi:chorismate dehydratase